MGIDKVGGGGKKIIEFESRNSSATDREIIERRAISIAVNIQNELRSMPFSRNKLDEAAEAWSGYEIRDLEQMLLTIPADWRRLNPERWFVLAKKLQEKYREREQDQLP
jgi:hypothetical protein